MKNALILHDTGASTKDNWYTWLQKELEEDGYTVWVPELPDSDIPVTDKYNNLLLNSNFNFTKDTIIVGHSSGGIAALQLLQALSPETVVKTVYLVSIFRDNLKKKNDSGTLIFQKILEPDLQFPTLRKKAQKFVIIHSTDDPFGPAEHAGYFAVKLDGELIITHGQKHFSVDSAGERYKEFPLLMELIKR